MPSVSIEDLEVRFPYDPYEIQKSLMSCVIKCIDKREHGLLESPTGTGKTASLLCAALAWQQNEKDIIRKTLQAGGSHPGFNARRGEEHDPIALHFMAATRIPKIIYATRTHSQIGQAMRELKRTSYNRVKAVILGSRDIMCIHEEVSRLAENSTKIMACHMKVVGRTCVYYNNVQKVREHFSVGDQPTMDIEELVSKGRSERFCPFFLSKELVADADLIFMPYNYLLDPKLRASHGVDLKGCIIILDEAHNITKVCEDSSSFELKSSIIAQCVREITKCLNEFNDLTEELKKSSSAAKDLSMGEIVKMKSVMLDLEKQLDDAPFSSDIPDSGKTVEGQEVLKCFFASGFTIDQFGRWIRVLDGVSSFLATNATEATGCDKFSGILRVLSTRLLSGVPDLFLNSYAVRVELESAKTTGQQASSSLTSFRKPKGKVFNFWCLNPAVGLDMLLQHNPRCIMLASGTLSPIEFLENELQMQFPVKIQNPHIITEQQLYAAMLKVGPGNVKLSSAFANRSKSEYIISLGEVIRKACSVVPEGVLVFFPSYSAMDQAVEYWQQNGHWENIAAEKSVYVEPRGKRALDDMIANYYTDTGKGSGSCLMAVCRGKVSEGLDFTDGKCRTVIITGLPYAPFKNEQVTSKMKYLDSKANKSQGVRGNVWYNIDAARALNQAVGRIIRHRNDYGAILLCDDRCDYGSVSQNLSSWVSSRLVKPNFTDMINQLQNFFSSYGVSLSGQSLSSSHPPSRRGLVLKDRDSDSGSFQISSQRKTPSRQIIKEVPLFNDVPEPEFSDLYSINDDEAELLSISASQLTKLSALESLHATTSPVVSFSSSLKSTVARKSSDVPSSSKTQISSNNGSSLWKTGVTLSTVATSNPKKKIKLVSENRNPTQYSRTTDNPRHVGLLKSGITQHHKLSSTAQVYQQTTAPKSSIFNKTEPLSSQVMSFGTVKQFGEWMKGKLNSDNYQKIMEEFKNYQKKNDVMKVLNAGKAIFSENADYRSYMKGLQLVTSKRDCTIIDDIISTYEYDIVDVEDC